MSDRRRHFRSQVHEIAELILRRGEDPYACTVRDASANGIQVDLDEALEFPEELTIRFSNEASLLVRRCWSSGTKLGLEFIGNTSEPGCWTTPPLLIAETKPTIVSGHVGIASETPGQHEELIQMLYPAEVTHALLVYKSQLSGEGGIQTGAEVAPVIAAASEPEGILDFFELVRQKLVSID